MLSPSPPVNEVRSVAARGPRPKSPAPRWALALKMRRLELGDLTQDDVAARTGDLVSPGTVSDLERGKATLDGLPTKRAAALARALGWSLADMQRATGVDLGIVEAETTADQATPIYKLQDLAREDASPDAYQFLRGEHPRNFRAVFADSDEMATTTPRSIQEGDSVFLDLDDRSPRPNRVYAVVYRGRVHLRRAAESPAGLVFAADNPTYALAFIPADQAEVLGRAYRVTADRSERQLAN